MKVNLIFAANEHMYLSYIKYFGVSKEENLFATNDALRARNHLNCNFILTDGYIVNPAFATNRYLACLNWAREAKAKDFITKRMMHDT